MLKFPKKEANDNFHAFVWGMILIYILYTGRINLSIFFIAIKFFGNVLQSTCISNLPYFDGIFDYYWYYFF